MANMAWRRARWIVVLALGGLACGRTELLPLVAETELGSTSGTATTDSSGGVDTGRPTTGLDSSGAGTTTIAVTTGFDSGVLDTGFDVFDGFDSVFEESGSSTTRGPGTSTSETATTATTTDGTTSDGGTTNGGTTEMGTTDGGTTTNSGTTDVSTTNSGTTDGSTTDSGTTDSGTTGGDPTCQDAVDCVLDCGGASFTCIGQCNDGLSPADDAAFNDLETCIIFACFFNGSCGFDFEAPGCVACRVDGQLDPAPLGCDDEALLCTG
jgi:hypothetical protein